MNDNQIDKIALASGLEKKLLADGTTGFRPYIYTFAQAITAQVYRDIEPHQAKDHADLSALQSKVVMQASEILRLRTNASNAVDCLGEENGNAD